MANIKLSEDKKLKFFPRKHSYVLGKKKLIGATSLLKNYFGEFDASKIAKLKVMIAKAKARKEGREVGEEGKISYWKKKWKESAEHGSRTHYLIELFLQGSTDPEVHKYEARDIKKFTQAKHWIVRNFENHLLNIRSEYLLYDEELGVAGTIDFLLIKGEKKKKSVTLVDFKTNDKITTTGYKNAKAQFPLEELPDCSYSKYTLQLSLYAYMLERQGYKVDDLILLHLGEDSIEEHKVPYRKDLIKKVLEHKDKKPTVVGNEL
jgi:hypothetical protein